MVCTRTSLFLGEGAVAKLGFLCCCVVLACLARLPLRVLLSVRDDKNNRITGSDIFEFPPLRTETSCLSTPRPADRSDAACRVLSPSPSVPPHLYASTSSGRHRATLPAACCCVLCAVCVIYWIYSVVVVWRLRWRFDSTHAGQKYIHGARTNFFQSLFLCRTSLHR